MRIEDWQRLSGGRGAIALGGDQLTPAQRRKLEQNPAIEQQVLEWLRGAGAPESYGVDTSRTGDRLVTSTTCEDVATGIQLTPNLPTHSRLVTAGMVLAGNGWTKRYLNAKDRKRKRFYFAPDKWLARE